MKLIIRQYLASLQERGELDSILPDLLSEMGYNVISRPQIGTVQHGVDVAAVSPMVDGKQKLYLFSIKSGDLDRNDWNNGSQALRPSLDQIIDVYIHTRIPIEYKNHGIVICLCFGGNIKENIQQDVAGYTKRVTSALISFEIWNGEKIAELILNGLLREELLPKELQSHFRKSVALTDEPDASYQHFSNLLRKLTQIALKSEKDAIRSARQIYICLWVLFVWAREAKNIEAPYRASELAMLSLWEILKPYINKENTKITTVLMQTIRLSMIILTGYIDERIAPHVNDRDALSFAVASHSATDINIALFDLLGRIAVLGLWCMWYAERVDVEHKSQFETKAREYAEVGLSLIENNKALDLPIMDNQATDIALFLTHCLCSGGDFERIVRWISSLIDRFGFAIMTRDRYPTCHTDYFDVANHPRDKSDEYFKHATTGSTFLPLLALWAGAFGLHERLKNLEVLVGKELVHCTLQLWTPSHDSEEHFYLNIDNHGRAICDLKVSNKSNKLWEAISKACETDKGFEALTTLQTGYWPIICIACRHWRLPLPPQLYISSLAPSEINPPVAK